MTTYIHAYIHTYFLLREFSLYITIFLHRRKTKYFVLLKYNDRFNPFRRLCNLQVCPLFSDSNLTPPGYVILLNITIHKGMMMILTGHSWQKYHQQIVLKESSWLPWHSHLSENRNIFTMLPLAYNGQSRKIERSIHLAIFRCTFN